MRKQFRELHSHLSPEAAAVDSIRHGFRIVTEWKLKNETLTRSQDLHILVHDGWRPLLVGVSARVKATICEESPL